MLILASEIQTPWAIHNYYARGEKTWSTAQYCCSAVSLSLGHFTRMQWAIAISSQINHQIIPNNANGKQEIKLRMSNWRCCEHHESSHPIIRSSSHLHKSQHLFRVIVIRNLLFRLLPRPSTYSNYSSLLNESRLSCFILRTAKYERGTQWPNKANNLNCYVMNNIWIYLENN